MADERYDAIVIGTSQGGRFLPAELARAGQKVALVERGPLGGVCVNRGCTPTKTMVASARIAYQARRGAEYGVRTGPVSVDLAAVRERKRAMVAGARQNYASLLAHDGLDLIEGEAHFTGPKTVEIALTDGGTRQISAPVVVIDAGTRPRPLAITGAGDIPILDSTSIMELDELPEHLIILGGGYIGLEFGQMFRRFGSEVTIVQTAARLMMIEDDDVSDEVATILRDDGITILTSSTPIRVEPSGDGGLRLTVRTQDGERQLEGSHLLSAIGRIPNTDALAPEAAGIRLDNRGFIEVDEYLETSVPGVYAMGDIKGGPGFTHLSYDDYRILHANLIKHEKASTRDRIVPYTVFIDPQLGRAGLTEREASAQGRAVRVAKLPMSAVIRALETGETRGFMKAVVDADSGQILGCAVLGSEGGEIMTMIQVAMLGKLTYTAMADAVFTHPLLAEGLNTLFAMFDAQDGALSPGPAGRRRRGRYLVPMRNMSPAVVADLAPSGVLRAAINLGNPVLAQGTPAEPAGVTVDIAREIAARLDVHVEFVCFTAARDSFEAMMTGQADVCFLAIEPAREAEVAFTAPYVLIEGVFAVPGQSPLATVEDVDSAGVRIGVKRGSAYDLFLSRTLRHATVVRGAEGTEEFLTRNLEAAAGIREPMTEFVATHPGVQLIEGRFMEIRQAVGTAKTKRPETTRFLHELVEELKATGFIADSLRRSGQSAAVAPAA